MNDSKQYSANNEQLLRLQACPMSAGVNWDPRDDTQADIVKWYAYYNKLPFDVRMGLADEAVLEAILSIAKNYGVLDEFKVGEISRMVREAFFKVANKEEVKKRAQEKLGITENDTELFYEAFKEIVELVRTRGREGFEKTTENIPIIPALKKYPGLGEQVLTNSNIKKLDTGEFVRPVISNWIDDYIQRKGAQAHDNIDRSDFLFNSENGRKLSIEERKLLGQVLDSYDNDTSVSIHVENQEVVFSEGYRPEKTKKIKDTNKEQKQKQEQKQEAPQEIKKSFFNRFKKPKQEKPKKEPKVDIAPPEQQKDEIILKSGPAEKPQTITDISPGKKQEPIQIPKEKKITSQSKPQRMMQQNPPSLDSVNVPSRKVVKEQKEDLDGKQEIGWFGENTGRGEGN